MQLVAYSHCWDTLILLVSDWKLIMKLYNGRCVGRKEKVKSVAAWIPDVHCTCLGLRVLRSRKNDKHARTSDATASQPESRNSFQKKHQCSFTMSATNPTSVQTQTFYTYISCAVKWAVPSTNACTARSTLFSKCCRTRAISLLLLLGTTALTALIWWETDKWETDCEKQNWKY